MLKPFLDIMPKEIWDLCLYRKLSNYHIDVDDNKCYLISEFEKSYQTTYDKNAKKRILKMDIFTPKFQKMAILNKQNLENIKSSNIL